MVVVDSNKDKVRSLQEGHGGWKSCLELDDNLEQLFLVTIGDLTALKGVLGKSGIVNRIDDDGDVYVEFKDIDDQWFNPEVLKVVDTSDVEIQFGDFVLVLDSYRTVKALQDKDHGGWTSQMRKTLGHGGLVLGVLSNGRARVLIGRRPWVFNVKALRLISRSDGRTPGEERAHAKGRATADERDHAAESAPPEEMSTAEEIASACESAYSEEKVTSEESIPPEENRASAEEITTGKEKAPAENDTGAKIRNSNGRDQLTKGYVKSLLECGVQPLKQYSMVGATTLQGEIMILLRITLSILSDSVFSVF
ncbi:hypothetical protein NP493_2127g00003 [Ridgeia piscesae]|uniref:Mind bomb SH3 repeat domain-containing protein n=1 Tax=Ridgeia piscesae TaxID=27915 RepID=A0AAD9JKI8_RIDPI|nr:hypothetical protein NP493_2127g00003 [Ridgeia piscesae]